MIDRQSAKRLSPSVQDMLFVMAVSNSCMNPLVYGSYTLDLRGMLLKLLRKTCCHSSAASDTIGKRGSWVWLCTRRRYLRLPTALSIVDSTPTFDNTARSAIYCSEYVYVWIFQLTIINCSFKYTRGISAKNSLLGNHKPIWRILGCQRANYLFNA